MHFQCDRYIAQSYRPEPSVIGYQGKESQFSIDRPNLDKLRTPIVNQTQPLYPKRLNPASFQRTEVNLDRCQARSLIDLRDEPSSLLQ
jgi:hypothetical protein